MNDDRDNSNIQSSSEGSSEEVNPSPEEVNPSPEEVNPSPEEVNPSPEEKDILALEQPIESDKEDPINKDSRAKGWLLLLALLVTLGTGFYFYTYKKDSSFFTTLPDSSMKLFSIAPQLKNLPDIPPKETLAIPPEEAIQKIEEAPSPNTEFNEMPTKSSEEVFEVIEETISPDTQSKEIPAEFSEKIVEQTKRTKLFNKTTNENEKTIDLLRNEIQSLKAELKQKSSPSQSLPIKKTHISGAFLEEKPEETTQQENKEPISTIIALPASSSPAKGEPLNQQSHLQKESPQKRSEEVQAYLDFVENTGGNLIELVEKGWARLQELVMNYRKNS